MRSVVAVCIALVGPTVAWAHDVLIFDVTPEDDWCAVVNEEATPGDIIRLAPGDYSSPCFIDRTPPEEQDEYTMVMSLDPDNPARILYDGESDSFIQVRGDQVMLMALAFEEIPAGVAAIKVIGEREIWLRYNRFSGEGAVGVWVEGGVDGLHLVDNQFDGLELGFSLNLGDGPSLVDLGDNLMTNVATAAQITGNWEGWIRDNIVLDVENGFLLDAGEYASPIVVHGNWIRSSTQALAIENGPLVLSNNIVEGEGLVWDLGESGRELGEVIVAGNSFLIQEEHPFEQTTVDSLTLYNNLSAAAFPVGEGTPVGSNVVCDVMTACWVNPDAGLFYPVDGAEGISVGAEVDELGLDFCGKERPERPTFGALEPSCDASPEPFVADFKSTYFCTYPVLGGDGGCEDDSDTGEIEPGVDNGCGCTSLTRSPRGWLALGIVALVVVRRRRLVVSA